MMKRQIKLPVVAALMLGLLVGFLAVMNARAVSAGRPNLKPALPIAGAVNAAPTAQILPNPPAKPVVAVRVIAPPVESSAVLDRAHRYALGMIETGNDDHEIGGLGEVSRYQIMPSVWHYYSRSRRYHDPEVSTQVAQQHWTVLHDFFRQQAHREPSDFDMYVLWNTHYGYYADKGFNPARLGREVRSRAQRFVNLVERGG